MNCKIAIVLSCLCVFALNSKVLAQAGKTNQDATEDTTIGVKPILKIENLSPVGHCDNQQLTFFAPWADHFEISKRRCDTNWINQTKYNNTWTSETLKANVNSIIYKRLDERGTYQFVVKAFKGNIYRESEIVTSHACIVDDIRR